MRRSRRVLPCPLPAARVSATVYAIVTLVVAVMLLLAWRSHHASGHRTMQAAPEVARRTNGPPWITGRRQARFTLIEYADLECPYCRRYTGELRSWIRTHPQVNWQWHHLPLAMHDPAATREAQLAECAGRVGGNAAFWAMVDWIFGHTRGNGEGLPPDAEIQASSPMLRGCLSGPASLAAITAQTREAARDHIEGTPTLTLLDHRTGRTLTLPGAVSGDALLSAIDQLSAATPAAEHPQQPTTRPARAMESPR